MAEYNFESFVNSNNKEEKEEKQFNFESFSGVNKKDKTNKEDVSKTDTAIDST